LGELVHLKCDVAIAGAGPVGLTLAKIIANNGYNVIILEEHSEVGIPQHCTGKITINALNDLQLKTTGALQKVKSATFYSPGLASFTVKREEVQALILNRRQFDQDLAKQALKAGANLFTNSRVKKFRVTSDNVIVSFDQKSTSQKIYCRLVVGADGATSVIVKMAGLHSRTPNTMRMGVQREISNIHTIPEGVELYLGQAWAPGFFAWIVPTGDETARVGLAVPLNRSKSAFKFLDAFMENHPLVKEKLRKYRVSRQIAHVIPVGGVLKRTVSDGVLCVGDAARQIKSTTGGGLYYGIACAQMAGDAVSRALGNSDCGVLKGQGLIIYEKKWREKFEKEIAFSVKARAFLDSLSEEEVDYLFEIIKSDASLIKRIEIDGDIDYQSRVIRSLVSYARHLIKKPRLIYKLMRFFPLIEFK
jgi:geranylgeranyl reductase family protein